MKHATRRTAERRAAFGMARKYAEEGDAAMMQLWIAHGKHWGGFTPKQLARLDRMLRENSAEN